MKKILLFGIMALFLFSCGRSKEERAIELIQAELFRTLHDFSSYEPIETVVDSAFSCVYTDPIIVLLATLASIHLENTNDHLERVRRSTRTMEIWQNSRTAYGRSRFNEANRESRRHLDRASHYLDLYHSGLCEIQELINDFESEFIGFHAKHRFRSRTLGGNFRVSTNLYLIDPNFTEIISVRDLNCEDKEEIRTVINEARRSSCDDA